ncbi:MAG: hypothetical protein E7012_05635 [Alphaproteobacteria bacterium]|nr:hypothetical protein [Alphaproteobacteria bacterium]
MKKVVLFLLSGILFSLSSHAQSINTDDNINTATTAKEVRLYNFSDELLTSATNCTPYKEDFTANNPKLKNIGNIFGGTDFQIIVEIKGFQDEMCHFVITQNMAGFGGTKNLCSIDKKTLSDIVKAMKDKSPTPITETFTTKIQITDENDKIFDTAEVQNTVTGSAFDIMFSKVQGNYCQLEEIPPQQEESELAQEKITGFSDKFITSLKNCSPDKEHKNILFVSIEAEIIGKKDSLCHVRTPDFNFYLSEDQIINIKSFDDLYEFGNNEKIAKYRIIDNYDLTSVFPAIHDCQQKKSANQGQYTTNSFGNIQKEKSVSAEYNDNKCILKLINKLTINEKITDYGLKCYVSNKNCDIIVSQYSSKENSSDIGKEILKALIKNKLCGKLTPNT